MELSNELVSQFVKITNDSTQTSTERTVYGTIKDNNGTLGVVIDGSTIVTPLTSTTTAKAGDRVMVLIKDHSAVVTGNMSSPSASQEEVEEVKTSIEEFDILLVNKITADEGKFKELDAKNAEISGKLTATEASIKTLEADNVTIKGTLEAQQGKFDTIDATFIDVSGRLEANEAEIEKLEAIEGDFRELEADYAEFKNLTVDKAYVDELTAKKLDADFGNFDTLQVNKEAVHELFGASGYFNDIEADEIETTYLQGVTIKGDIIEGGTIKADKLIIKDEDSSLYYQLNLASFENGKIPVIEEVPIDSIHGSIITAESITAEHIHVSDLAAFKASIGGFKIVGNEDGSDGKIHSVLKETPTSDARGVYMDTGGQFSIGDDKYYLRYIKMTEDGEDVWRMLVSAESLLFGMNTTASSEDFKNLLEYVKVGTYHNPKTNNTEPSLEMTEDDTDSKTRFTSTHVTFYNDRNKGTTVSVDGIETTGDIKQGGFVWKKRQNGNIHKLGLTWEGVDV